MQLECSIFKTEFSVSPLAYICPFIWSSKIVRKKFSVWPILPFNFISCPSTHSSPFRTSTPFYSCRFEPSPGNIYPYFLHQATIDSPMSKSQFPHPPLGDVSDPRGPGQGSQISVSLKVIPPSIKIVHWVKMQSCLLWAFLEVKSYYHPWYLYFFST